MRLCKIIGLFSRISTEFQVSYKALYSTSRTHANSSIRRSVHLCEIDFSIILTSEAEWLTKSGHSIACFIKQQEGNHEEGVWGTQNRLERYKLLKGDQPERGEKGRKTENK